MAYLTQDQIHEIHSQAVNRTPGLLDAWKQMLIGLPIAYMSTLPNIDGNKNLGLLAQLSTMNEVDVIKGGVVPLEVWLNNAAYFSELFPDSQKLYRDYARVILEKRAITKRNATSSFDQTVNAPSLKGMSEVKERIIFINEMVPYGFAQGAVRTGQSVARLIVPRFDGKQPRKLPFTDEQIKYFGTGWLLGTRHIVTNHHVINARDAGEADAISEDFNLQGIKTTVQFDYNQRNAAGDPRSVKQVSGYNKELDYAVLELEAPSGREPLPVFGGQFVLPAQSLFPVNLIQHPGGEPKKLGIRSNLVAAVNEVNLAYFTDTEPGSSGSPVCSDDWYVLALHKASSASYGEFEYQGKQTAWVNHGTRIDVILADLKQNHSTLWNLIGANVV
ncbi:hypothetical protein Psta_0285 [Pirellula staleyi DSM 6068]|uniref:Effector-associated domain-containing protein n=1 Tax=Pirellula staleyi (strain ATCC 27377 / DSM 6068 / ICPB 4128) TaxID=530564 RepID=D2R1J3_PIRSD|nr:trypsin-like peptidase domain-containing protein [Pirellula staleyi]ADB14978.1 hypothetical protein Psta_0285 [Pirellula staleyi DSM 6068]